MTVSSAKLASRSRSRSATLLASRLASSFLADFNGRTTKARSFFCGFAVGVVTVTGEISVRGWRTGPAPDKKPDNCYCQQTAQYI